MKSFIASGILFASLSGKTLASPFSARDLVLRPETVGKAIFHKDDFVGFNDESEWKEDACSLVVTSVAGYTGVFGPWTGPCTELPNLGMLVEDRDVNGTSISIDTVKRIITFTDVSGGEHSCEASGFANGQGCKEWKTTISPELNNELRRRELNDELLRRQGASSSSSPSSNSASYSDTGSSSLSASSSGDYSDSDSYGFSGDYGSSLSRNPGRTSQSIDPCTVNTSRKTKGSKPESPQHWVLHKQVTDNVGCRRAPSCSASKSDGHSFSIGFTSSATLFEFITAGFSVTKTVNTGQIAGCNQHAHNSICVFKTVPHIAYSVRNHETVCNCGGCHTTHSKQLRIRAPNHAHSINHYCGVDKQCHHLGYSFWKKKH